MLSLIVVLIIFHYAVCLEYTERNPFEGGFKSMDAVEFPSCQTYDKYGNILLSGRLGQEPAFFQVTTSFKQEDAELSVVFCTEDENVSCGNKGLVLCYPSNPNATLGSEDTYAVLSEKQDYLKRMCDDMNGVLVSIAEVKNNDENRKVFQVDTVYGNTYMFEIPNHKCFVLWLTFDVMIYSSGAVFEKFEDYLTNPITVDNEIRNLNFTPDELDYRKVWSDVAVGLDRKYIWMKQKEVIAWAMKDGPFLTIPFVAHGAEPCCAITARITGPRLSKCFHKWVQIGEECRSKQPGGMAECEIPYTVGRRNVTVIHNIVSSEDGQSMIHRNRTYNKHDDSLRDYIDAVTAREALDRSLREVLFNASQDDIDRILIHVNGFIDITAELKVGEKFYLKAVANIAGGYFSDKQNHSTDIDSVDWQRRFNNSWQRNLKQLQDRNRLNDAQDSIKSTFGSKFSEAISKDALNILSENQTEIHKVRNVVTWPDVLRLGQLHFVCHEHVWALNVTADFGNNKQLLEEVAKKEVRMGYPNETEYEKCSFGGRL